MRLITIASSAAVTALNGAIWMGNEYIPPAPRTQLADWGTFITRLPLAP
jgi:hypothetical protein